MVQPTEITFGEPYGDGSGYAWSITYRARPAGPAELIIAASGGDARVDPMEVRVREMAKALDAIADLLGEDK